VGKWFTNTIAALFILALTSLIGALLKSPIDGLANANRLNAEVLLSPWVPKPSFPAQASRNEPVVLGANNSKDLVESLEIKTSSIGDYGIAVMNVENGSSNDVKNINIRIDETYISPDVLYIDASDRITLVGETNRIKLPDMSPGDRTKVYFWGNFSSYDIKNRFKTYSSEGPFRLVFEWAEIKDFEYNSIIGTFLDDYAWEIFIVNAVILIVGLTIAVSVQSDYIKGLLVFEINPAQAQSAWQVFQGRMKAQAAPMPPPPPAAPVSEPPASPPQSQ
jgi:hypothetical protein